MFAPNLDPTYEIAVILNVPQSKIQPPQASYEAKTGSKMNKNMHGPPGIPGVFNDHPWDSWGEPWDP